MLALCPFSTATRVHKIAEIDLCYPLSVWGPQN